MSFKNTVGKGEIAHNEQFLLFPQCFLQVWRTYCHFNEVGSSLANFSFVKGLNLYNRNSTYFSLLIQQQTSWNCSPIQQTHLSFRFYTDNYRYFPFYMQIYRSLCDYYTDEGRIEHLPSLLRAEHRNW